MRMIVTPVVWCPRAIAQLMGAAPRSSGSSEAWRFMAPRRGAASTSADRRRLCMGATSTTTRPPLFDVSAPSSRLQRSTGPPIEPIGP